MSSNQATAPAQSKPEVPVIHKNAVYNLDQARAALGLAKATLGREVRLGRLRVSKRAGKYLILGGWILEWVAAGEIRRRKREPETVSNG